MKSILIFFNLFLWFTFIINLEVSYTNSFLFSLIVENSNTPIPIHIFKDLYIRSRVLSYRNDELWNKSGIYAFINTINGKQYIGSSLNLYKRMLDHIAGRRSNISLQRAFDKYGKDNFHFVIYAYAPYVLPSITDLETLFMSYFPFDNLYNLTRIASSMYGYKHTDDAIAKMKARLINPINHPMFGKNHTLETGKFLSKSGNLNPMFGRKHKIESIKLISDKRSTSVTLYNNNNNYIITFKNNVTLSKFLNCHKGTVGRYLRSGKLFKKAYYIRAN